MGRIHRFDIVIIGSGFGGATAAHVLRDTGASILILERGGFLPQEKQNWDVAEVSAKRRYCAEETWFDEQGKPFSPRIYYNVGGCSKVFGGAALRFRAEDFISRPHYGGSTPDWPFSYQELKPYYDRAERLLQVHGMKGSDPTEPDRGDFPFPPVPHEPVIAELAERWKTLGLRPFHLPLAIDQGPGGRCQKGSPCDGFPCMVRAKLDAENAILRPMLLKKPANLNLWTGANVRKLETGASGNRVIRAEVEKADERIGIEADRFILSAGAVNSAAILLRSKTRKHPSGLANSSGLVGRNFMSHNNSVLLALSPWRMNPTRFQKTLAVNDFYNSGPGGGKPLGHIQMRGKVKPQMLGRGKPAGLRLFSSSIAQRSIDLWVMTEDLGIPENRVVLDDQERIHLLRKGTNSQAHEALLDQAGRIMKRAGYPICIVDRRGITAIQHQCGTIRFGNESRTAVLDPWCRAYDLENLYVMDASFFPTSGAVNPSLTIVAQVLRAAEHLKGEINGAV
jgi:choline dehydrogenase-like flavoprotein